MDRSTTALGLPLVVVLVLLAFGTSRPAASPLSDLGPTTETPSDTMPADRAGLGIGPRMIEAFYGTPFDSIRCDEGCPWDVLIVGLPDPWGSRLDWMRDAGLDALRRALETAGYALDRFSFPGSDSVTVEDGSRARRIEVQPGVMLYRSAFGRSSTHPTDRERLLLTYLVHERPTAGVYPEALRRSLEERAQVLTRARRLADLPVRVLGPLFSGSSPSYRRALESFSGWGCDKTPGVEFVSGTATSGSNKEVLSGAITLGCDAQVPSSFHATQTDNEALISAVVDLILGPMGADTVALLQETTTAFGQASGRCLDGPSRDECQGNTAGDASGPTFIRIPFPLNISRLEGAFTNGMADVPAGFVQAVAPGDRTELSLQVRQQAPETPLPTSDLSPAVLEVAAREIVRTLRALRVDAVGILATDDRDKLFVARLVRDGMPDVQLFTVESNLLLLRRDYGDWLRGMVVASTYPLVLQSQEWAPRGTSVDSARAPVPHRIVFANDRAIGVFNAALFLLGQDSLAVEYRLPVDACAPPPGAGASEGALPPIWLTAVGRSGFVPLKCRYQSVSADPYLYVPDSLQTRLDSLGSAALPLIPVETGTDPPADFRARVPRSTALLGVSVALGMLFFGLWATLMWVQPKPGAPSSGDAAKGLRPLAKLLVVLLGKHEEEGASSPDSLDWLLDRSLSIHWNVYASLLVAGLFFGAHAVWVMAWPRSGAMAWLPRAAALVAVVPLLVIVIRALYAAASFRKESFAFGRGDVRLEHCPVSRASWIAEVIARGTVVLGLLALLVLHGAYAWDVETVAPRDLTIYAQRIRDAGAGLSPLMFLAIATAALALWATWHLLRIHMLCRARPFDDAAMNRWSSASVVPTQERRTVTPRGWRDAWNQALDAISDVRCRLFFLLPDRATWIYFLFTCGLIVWVGYLFAPTLEGAASPIAVWPWEILLRAYVLGTLVVIALGILRLARVWSALRRALVGIAETPLLDAFGRLASNMKRTAQLTSFSISSRAFFDRAAESQGARLFAASQRLPKSTREYLGAFLGTTDVGWVGANLTDEGRSVANGEKLSRLWAAVARQWAGDPCWSVPADDDESAAAPRRRWTRAAEEFLAIQFLSYVDWALRQVRVMGLFLLAMILMASILFSSYPFVPQGVAKMVLLILVAFAGLSFLVLLFQLSRDELLSRAAGTSPGKVSWNTSLVTNILLFVAVPLVAALSSQFPAVREVLFAWLSPVGQALRTF